VLYVSSRRLSPWSAPDPPEGVRPRSTQPQARVRSLLPLQRRPSRPTVIRVPRQTVRKQPPQSPRQQVVHAHLSRCDARMVIRGLSRAFGGNLMSLPHRFSPCKVSIPAIWLGLFGDPYRNPHTRIRGSGLYKVRPGVFLPGLPGVSPQLTYSTRSVSWCQGILKRIRELLKRSARLTHRQLSFVASRRRFLEESYCVTARRFRRRYPR
jgi:hypothetical protein